MCQQHEMRRKPHPMGAYVTMRWCLVGSGSIQRGAASASFSIPAAFLVESSAVLAVKVPEWQELEDETGDGEEAKGQS